MDKSPRNMEVYFIFNSYLIHINKHSKIIYESEGSSVLIFFFFINTRAVPDRHLTEFSNRKQELRNWKPGGSGSKKKLATIELQIGSPISISFFKQHRAEDIAF